MQVREFHFKTTAPPVRPPRPHPHPQGPLQGQPPAPGFHTQETMAVAAASAAAAAAHAAVCVSTQGWQQGAGENSHLSCIFLNTDKDGFWTSGERGGGGGDGGGGWGIIGL